MNELTPEQKQEKSKLIEELVALNGRRSLIPNIQDNGRTREVMNQLYIITGNNIYKV